MAWRDAWHFKPCIPAVRHRRPWAGEIIGMGSKSRRGPIRCRFGRQIVQRPCMLKERFPPRVFSAEIFSQLGGI
jgi:hypothetical protein